METLKKVINVLAMLYLVIVLLFLLHILSVSKFVALFDLSSDTVFYNRLLWAGVLLLLAELLVENAYIANLRKGLTREHQQIMELKAQLYDQRMKDTNAAPLAANPNPEANNPQTTTLPMWSSTSETTPTETGTVVKPIGTHPPSDPTVDPHTPSGSEPRL